MPPLLAASDLIPLADYDSDAANVAEKQAAWTKHAEILANPKKRATLTCSQAAAP